MNTLFSQVDRQPINRAKVAYSEHLARKRNVAFILLNLVDIFHLSVPRMDRNVGGTRSM